ncbi:MAG TPA: HupE/UreJ family protein [Candidatus Peribacteria bacterium]|nr:HupE/UreJ family protein [Candidatus Peribacteria bacterium]
MSRFSRLSLSLLGAQLLLFPAIASAHLGTGAVGGFQSGFIHPLTGLDHIIAMVGVGILGAFLGHKARWTLPVIFPLVMSVGGVLGIIGFPVPYVETGIALSGVVIGLMIATGSKKIPLWLAGVLVAVFAICHGYAHGEEMPGAANALTFAIGFVLATGMLHLAGIAIGLLEKVRYGTIVLRLIGLGIAILGGCFLFGIL